MALRAQTAALVTAFPSAARTATPTPAVFTNEGWTAMVVYIDVTAVTATPAVTFNIDWVDPISGKTGLILASTVIATVTTTVLKVSRFLTAAANLVALDILPARFQIRPVHGDADSATYTVACHLLP